MPRHSYSRRHNKKHRQRFNSGKPHSFASQRIHNVYGESIGRPNEQMVLEVANNEVRRMLREFAQRGKIVQVNFETELYAPFCTEDRQGKDLRITFSDPEKLNGKSIFIQIKSSQEGAKNFRLGHRSDIPVIIARKNKDPQRDRLRIARCLVGMIWQELKKDEPVEASA